jgi:CheY-like chemotaxis protein
LPRAEENIVDGATLVGCSILVLEEQAFVARCLRILLEDAGAEVHNATSAGDALHLIDRTGFSAAVVSCSKTTKGRPRLVQRLARVDLPLVLCKDIDQRDTWPGIPALIKPVIGLQLVEILCGLILADKKNSDGVACGPTGGNANTKAGQHRLHFTETSS